MTSAIGTGGMGARPTKDGVECVQTDASNAMNIPVEATETYFPLRVTRWALRSDSGGAGRHRGGLGLEYFLEVLDSEVQVSHRGERHYTAPWGLFGGGPGACSRGVLIRDGAAIEIPSKLEYTLRAGERVEYYTTGGGGYGDPLERQPSRVLDDVLDRKVSVEVRRRSVRRRDRAPGRRLRGRCRGHPRASRRDAGRTRSGHVDLRPRRRPWPRVLQLPREKAREQGHRRRGDAQRLHRQPWNRSRDAFIDVLERERPDVVAVDSGSLDCGPWYLGTGQAHSPHHNIRRDLDIVLTECVGRGIPFITGTAGGSGARAHVDLVIDMARDIARERGLRFDLGVAYSDLDKETLKSRLRDGVVMPRVPADILGEPLSERPRSTAAIRSWR